VLTAIHPIGTPNGLSPNTGPLASAAWLVARGLSPTEAKWFVEIEIPAAGNSDNSATEKLLLEIYAEALRPGALKRQGFHR
jgi:hypothetical protein